MGVQWGSIECLDKWLGKPELLHFLHIHSLKDTHKTGRLYILGICSHSQDNLLWNEKSKRCDRSLKDGTEAHEGHTLALAMDQSY